jgi:hypothetical protein
MAPPPEAAAPPGAPGPMIPNPAPLAESGNGHKLVDEIRSRISGFFNQTEGTFTIGEEGFVTKMCKELKEKYHVPPGTHKAERFDHMVERACTSIMEKYKQRHSHSRELSDMRRMAGIMEAGMQMPGMDDFGDMDGMMKNIRSKIPSGNMKSSNTSSGTINGKPASYDDAMSKFKGMAGGMGLDAGGDDPVGGMYKGIQGKFGDMMKGMNMPSMPGTGSSKNSNPSVSPTRAGTTPDLKVALAKMKPTSPDDAMKMLADLKKLAGLTA